MASFSTAALVAFFQQVFNGVAWPYGRSLYWSLHNSDPGPTGLQSTAETTYANYARVALAASPGTMRVSSPPVMVQNLQTVSFPACGPTGDTVSYWGLGTQASGDGQLITTGPLALVSQAYGFTGASSGLISAPGYSPLVNAQVMAYGIGPGLLLPSGLVEGTIYYVGTVSGAGFTLSTTPNNASPLTLTAAGSGVMVPCSPLVITQNIAPTFPPGNLISYTS